MLYLEAEHTKGPSISDVLDQPYERRFLDGVYLQPLKDSDVGEILGVDGENVDEAVQARGVGIRDFDVEEELLAARSEE